eukprot:TRINITY_DN2391_c0_g2_i1.p1 TRINITY_DN2391_c0_g2~~TRINITY_DN2391_c0_g2_i1.p1  ORF type:complete len:558 (+),score=174.50 TRINITY_DN2391_c0_g2_i1:37-1710(+)
MAAGMRRLLLCALHAAAVIGATPSLSPSGSPSASPAAAGAQPTASPAAAAGQPTASPAAAAGQPTASPAAAAGQPTASPAAAAGQPTAGPAAGTPPPTAATPPATPPSPSSSSNSDLLLIIVIVVLVVLLCMLVLAGLLVYKLSQRMIDESDLEEPADMQLRLMKEGPGVDSRAERIKFERALATQIDEVQTTRAETKKEQQAQVKEFEEDVFRLVNEEGHDEDMAVRILLGMPESEQALRVHIRDLRKELEEKESEAAQRKTEAKWEEKENIAKLATKVFDTKAGGDVFQSVLGDDPFNLAMLDSKPKAIPADKAGWRNSTTSSILRSPSRGSGSDRPSPAPEDTMNAFPVSEQPSALLPRAASRRQMRNQRAMDALHGAMTKAAQHRAKEATPRHDAAEDPLGASFSTATSALVMPGPLVLPAARTASKDALSAPPSAPQLALAPLSTRAPTAASDPTPAGRGAAVRFDGAQPPPQRSFSGPTALVQPTIAGVGADPMANDAVRGYVMQKNKYHRERKQLERRRHLAEASPSPPSTPPEFPKPPRRHRARRERDK